MNKENSDGIMFDETGDIIDNDVDGKLNDWLASNDIQLNEIQCTVYRWVNPEGSSEKAQVDFIKGDIPERHSIGLKHGAGKYTIIIVKPKIDKEERKITSRTFMLGEYYNTLMQEEKLKNNPYANMPGFNPMMYPIQQKDNGNSNMDMIKIMSQMMQNTMSMLSPILAAAIAPRTDNGKNDISAYSMIDKILQNNAKNNIEFYGELQKKIVDNDMELNQVEKPGLIEQLLPLIDRFMPMFTKKETTPEAETILQGIKASEQYKQVTENKDVVKKLISHLEKKHGKKKLDNALKKLNIPRPKD